MEGTQTGLMEQIAALVHQVDELEAHSSGQHLCIQELEQKVGEGEEALLKCTKALEIH